MRDILFRGKLVDDGKWVYGWYLYRNCVENDTHYIAEQAGLYHQVVPETVGQYTGLKDKNGVKIFEGDKVRDFHAVDREIGFDDGHFVYIADDLILDLDFECHMEVVGTVHDKATPNG